MRKLSKEELYPSYEEQMTYYRDLWKHEVENDADGNLVPDDLFWEIVDFLAQKPKYSRYLLTSKWSIKHKTAFNYPPEPRNCKTIDNDVILLDFFASNTIEELYEFREQEMREGIEKVEIDHRQESALASSE